MIMIIIMIGKSIIINIKFLVESIIEGKEIGLILGKIGNNRFFCLSCLFFSCDRYVRSVLLSISLIFGPAFTVIFSATTPVMSNGSHPPHTSAS